MGANERKRSTFYALQARILTPSQWEAYTDPFTATALAIASTRLLLNVRQASTRESQPLYSS